MTFAMSRGKDGCGVVKAQCCGALCAVQLLQCSWDGSYCIAASASARLFPITDKANMK